MVDNYLNIDSHQRLDKGFQDKLIEEATLKSYENTTKTVGKVKISRQTVKRLIHAYHPDDIKKVVLPEKEKKKYKFSCSVVNRGKFMYDEYDNIDILKKSHRTPIYKILKEIKGVS